MAALRVRGLWWATVGLLAASMMVNVAQAHRLRGSVAPHPKDALLGHSVRPIPAMDQNGRALTIRFDRNVPTVLYYFSPSCGWCERNWDNVEALSKRSGGRYRVVAIAAETSLAEFIARHPLSLEVYGGISNDVRETLGLSGTPRTLVVSSEGFITHDWTGAFSGAVALAVEEVFGLDLPGLRAPSISTKPAH